MIRQVVPQQCPGLAALVVAAYQEYALVLRANAWEQNWWFVFPCLQAISGKDCLCRLDATASGAFWWKPGCRKLHPDGTKTLLSGRGISRS